MSLIEVDGEKCSRDGICIEVCPLGLLSPDTEGRPEMSPEAAGRCIGCGHCVAVCPSAALDNRTNPLSNQKAIPEGYSFDPALSELFLRSRRSIRRYRDEPVPREKILKLLDIARFAPSGHNSQGISYLVVEGAENIRRLTRIVIEWMREAVNHSPKVAKSLNMDAVIRAHENGQDRVLRSAPHVIVAHAPVNQARAPVSTMLALEYIELYAPSLGIGTCWAGYAQTCAKRFPPFSQFLKIPAKRKITGILMAGYPRYRYRRLPERNPLDAAWFEP